MTSIEHITIEAADVAAAEQFYSSAFGLGDRIRVRASDAPTSGFRGFTLSITVSQPGNVDAYLDAALAGGATTVKAAAKSLWGYGGTVQAPDGTIWKVATTAKKNKAPVAREYDEIVLLLGASDVAASKQFYVNHGITVGKSFGRSYVQFTTPPGSVGFGLYRRDALAKDAGVPPEGSGSHCIVIGGDAGAFTDPDGFVWEASARG